MENKKEFYKRFAEIQNKLKVPKENKNNFGNYNYRSAEDILSNLKNILKFSDGECVFLDNEIKFIENRFYVESIAIFTNGEFEIKARAQAREEETKKGMDGSQITGSATSYARKYALAGLFGIDNEKDSDSDDKEDNDGKNNSKKTITKPAPAPIQEKKPVVEQKVKTETKKLSYMDFKTKLENATTQDELRDIFVSVGGAVCSKDKKTFTDFENVKFSVEGDLKEQQIKALSDLKDTIKNELNKE